MCHFMLVTTQVGNIVVKKKNQCFTFFVIVKKNQCIELWKKGS